ncbi:ribosomal biogenesis factor isoform X2 [Amia ocellicauda]
MAKNKPKGQKQKSVFHVSNKQAKHKTKTKPVTRCLKRMNAAKKEKVDNINKVFTEVQREVKTLSKCTAPQPKPQPQVTKAQPIEVLNVDDTAQLFSQL